MNEFIRRHEALTIGMLEGFDRVLFRGTLRSINYRNGLSGFLWRRRIPWKDFGDWAHRATERLAAHARQVAQDAGRPYQYVSSAAVRKEDLVAEIVRRDGVREGLVCVLACVEPCLSADVNRNRAIRKLELVYRMRKCRFFYFYYVHPDLGLLHVRLQSWLPFDVQVCLNGRSYLQRQLDDLGIAYRKADNCFLEIADLPHAQRILDELISRDWGRTLDGLVGPLLKPLREKGEALQGVEGYYWTIRQSEFATDVMFRDAAALGQIYPDLCRHAIERFSCADVLRFLGHKTARDKEVTTDLQRRVEGVRVKHRAGDNSVKMYDKQGRVLRIETTLNDPRVFRVYRRAESKPDSPLRWRTLRKGIADIAPRVQGCRAANARYLEALAAVEPSQPVHRVLDPVSRTIRHDGQSSRALRPLDPQEAALFQAVLAGEHLLVGFTNADVRRRLFASAARDPAEHARRARYVTHRLRLLRRHGLIHKVPGRKLYRISAKGHQIMGLGILLRQSNAKTLLAA